MNTEHTHPYPPPDLRWLALLFLAALAAHGLALIAPFQFDDINHIANNPAFRSWRWIDDYFTDPYIGIVNRDTPMYRPLLLLTFLWDGLIGQGTAWPYRLTSITLLALLAWAATPLAARFLDQLSPADRSDRAPALTAFALLVVIHPVFNETILLASSRSSLLMGLFGVLALEAMLRPAAGRALLFTLLALLSKEGGVALGPLALLAAWLAAKGPTPWNRLLRAWPVVLPVALYVLFYRTGYPALIEHTSGHPLPDALTRLRPWSEHLSLSGAFLLDYLALMLIPWGYQPLHPAPTLGPLTSWSWLSWPLLAAVGLWLLHTARLRLVGAAVLWFLVALAPVLLAARLNLPVGEHRLVLASLLPLLAQSQLWASLTDRMRRPVATTVVTILLTSALWHSWPWRDPRSLWEFQVTRTPNDHRAWNWMANARDQGGDRLVAITAIERAIALRPDYPPHQLMAAEWALDSGGWVRARAHLETTKNAAQDFPLYHQLRARLDALTDRPDSALPHIQRALELDPDNSTAWNDLGNVQLLRRDYAAAAQAYRRALELDAKNDIARQNLLAVEGKERRGR